MEEFDYYPDGGFFALGELPSPERPQNWLAWHFTHESNIESILKEGALLPSAQVAPVTNVGQLSIKQGRTSRVVDLDGAYPTSTVADHVPLYLAARSPMLFRVCRGHSDYRGGAEPLVFLGFCVGDIDRSGSAWCASDANAATRWAAFTRDLDDLGNFVDFELLTAKMWSNTLDDPSRQSRRAAEVLVLDRLPISLVRLVVVGNRRVLTAMERLFDRFDLHPEIVQLAEMHY